VFSIKLTGMSGAIVKDTTFSLTVENPTIAPILTTPANGMTGVLNNPTLAWVNAPEVTNYEYQVSALPNGGDIVSTGFTPSASVVVSPELELTTTYFWRVRSITTCGSTPWSEEWTFETGTCVIKSANDLPIVISSEGTPTITSNLTFIDKGVVTDLNVISLIGTHSYIQDLNFTLIAPDGTSQDFWTSPCDFHDDFNINFNDEASSSEHPCPPTDGLTYIPDNPLNIFDTKELQGEWTLSVFDYLDDDGGSLDSWGLEICLGVYCDLTVDNSAYIDSYGTLLSALDCAVDGDTIFLESSIANNTINIGSTSIAIDQNIVIIADQTDNIKVLSNGTVPTFIINAGKTVSLIGFDIENTNSFVGVLENNGTLILRDLDITSGVGKPSIVNDTGALLNVEGNCNVYQN